MNLKVGIDVSALSAPRTGIGYYTANLVAGLRRIPGLDLAYFTGTGWKEEFTLDFSTTPRRHIAVRMISRTLGLLGGRRAILKNLFNQYYLEGRFRAGVARLGLELVHGTNYQIIRCAVPSILTIYDISCFRHPETHPPSRVEWQKRQIPKCIEACDHIITISEFSRTEIMDYFGVPGERISVCYCGADERFRPRQETELREALAAFDLAPGGYVLTVGTIEPRKNLATLVEAHAALPADVRRRLPLVIAGMRGWMESDVVRLLEKPVREGAVRVPGYVDHDVLPLLYAGAAVFAYPSLYEGFGIPPLEAMASGVPTLVSNRSALPEVAGDAALCLEAMDVGAWRDALLRVAADDTLRRDMAEAGMRRAALFTWKRTADDTVAVYAKVAPRHA